MKIQNALVSNMLDRSQRYFAHVTTVTLLCGAQNIVVIGCVYFTLECFEFSSNFEFDRNMLSRTGARSVMPNASFCASRVWDSHVRDNTVEKPSYISHWDPYTGKMTSLY